MIHFIFSIFLVFVFTGTGFFCVKRIGFPDLSVGDGLLLSFGSGYALFGLAVFILGLLGGLKVEILFLLLLSGSVLSVIELSSLVRSVRDSVSFRKLFMLVPGLFLVGATIVSLAPVSHYDAVFYHFALPKLYLSKGAIFDIPGYAFSHAPQLAEMINLFSMAIFSDRSAVLLNSYFGLFTAAVVFSAAMHFMDKKVAVLATTLFLCSPLVLWTSSGGFVEPPLTFFTAFSLYLFARHLTRPCRRILIFSGVFLGVAFSIKLLAAAFFLPMAICLVLVPGLKKQPCKKSLSDLSVWLAAVLVCGFPWYLFNFIKTGNPFFPVLYGIFGGSSWTPAVDAVFRRYHEAYGVAKSLASFVGLPYFLSFEGDLFFKGRFLGPLFLSFVPFAFFDRRYLKQSLTIAAVAAGYLTIWFFGSQQARFLVPLLPVACILAAVGITFPSHIGKRSLARFSGFATALFVVFGMKIGYDYCSSFGRVAVGLEKKDRFLKERIAGYDSIVWMNGNLSGKDKVLMLGLGHYYLDLPYMEGGYGIQGRIDYDGFKNADELYATLKSYGVTHLYYFSLYPHLFDRLNLWHDFRAEYLEKIHEDKWVSKDGDEEKRRGIGIVYRFK